MLGRRMHSTFLSLVLLLLVLTACAPGTASARTGSHAVPRDRGVVVGGIDRCSGLGIVTGPRYQAGVVTVFAGRAVWTHTRHHGYRWIFPKRVVTRVHVATNARYRFVLRPGHYLLKARFPPPANIFPFVNVTVKAGKTTHADIPNMCM